MQPHDQGHLSALRFRTEFHPGFRFYTDSQRNLAAMKVVRLAADALVCPPKGAMSVSSQPTMSVGIV